MWKRKFPLFALLALLGCGGTQEFVAVPKEISRATVPTQTVEVTAEDFHFTPDIIHVKKGTLLTLIVRSIEGTHGFKIGAFGIDETIEENQTRIIELYAGKEGEYNFRCSHFCGLGHLGMTGKVIVE
jgi:heme/copper-type cytochrome/quinol oxidase subunit 2